MAHFYDLPCGVPAGTSEAKLPDAQAGYEKGMTDLLAAQAGGNIIYEAAGMHASLLGCCLESFVIDNDMLGAVLRTVRGIEVSEDSLSVDAIREVCAQGPGHFLGHEQAATDADRVPLSRGGRSLEPQGMGGARRAGRPGQGTRTHARDPG